MIDTERLNTLASVKLHAGNNDKPACASSAIANFAIGLNDASVFAKFRQELLPFAVRIAGTAGTPEQEQTRAFILADWSFREIAPFALDARGLSEQAEVLRHLAPITNRETARAAAAAAAAVYAAARAAAAAAAAVRAVAYAADAAAAARAASYAAAADAARAAADAVAYAAVAAASYAVADAAARAAAAAAAVAKDPRIVWDMCLEVLDKLIKVTE